MKRRKTDKKEPLGREQLRVVIVGHVDHGKSTLIGRLLHDTGSLPDGKLEELEEICKRRGTDALEWSFVLDSFQAERDQAITIDTTQIPFATDKRSYIIIDAPGHREFLKNMISGASTADAAVLIVDAMEGVREQTRRHAYMLSLLGLKQIAVVVNKMDSAQYDPKHFEAVSKEIKAYLKSIGLTASSIMPASARNGEMVVDRGENMDWYQGKALTDVLDAFDVTVPLISQPLRFPIQDVYRHGEKRILVGRVETGGLSKGDTLLFSPTNEEATITSIESWPDDRNVVAAQAGQSIGITLDQPIFVERGHIASHDENPPMLSNVLRANIFWLSEKPLKTGNTYKIRCGTNEAAVSVQAINKVIDTQTLAHEKKATHVERNAVAEVTLRAKDMLPVDPYTHNDKLGRLVIYEGHNIVGAGSISMEGYPDQRISVDPKSENIHHENHLITREARASSMGHYGGVFWFTGLSGSGKTTTAMAVERALVEKGFKCYVLDGDNVRHGLNRDLGFAPEDRAENIRRIGEVAALMADAGLVVITSFISPYRADRDRVRKAAPHHFHEIHVKADLETCESRDAKGLYKKARAGEIKEFTGIDSPYEEPENPELVIDTQGNDVATCIVQVVSYVENQIEWSQASEEDARVQANQLATG